MNQTGKSSIQVRVDPANPGQFFACCGLLELAERLWGGAEGWFNDGAFYLSQSGTNSSTQISLNSFLSSIAKVNVLQIDPNNDYSSPIEISFPFKMRLDWWSDVRAGGGKLKVWAGSMRSVRIARAMQNVLKRPEFQNEALLDYGMVVYDPLEPDKKSRALLLRCSARSQCPSNRYRLLP